MSTIEDRQTTFLQKLQTNEPVLHVFFWAIYLLIPFLKSISRGIETYHFYSELNDLVFGIIVFYVAYLFFFPSKIKLVNSALLILFFCVVGYFNLKVHNWLFRGTHQEVFWYYALGYISTYTILTLFAYVLYSIKEAYKKQMQLEDLIRKKQQAELSGLKAQINPHFLFNTLNAIYANALKKDDKTPEMILRLSDSFRYVLHEGQKDRVSLKKEINHLKDYINLQSERLSDKIKANLSVNIDNYEQEIAPLLLISFLENAFKYTSSLRSSQHLIKINISLKDKTFKFQCENPFNDNVKKNMNENWKESGIGLTNTKKRLQYLYPKKHDLKINTDNSIYKVTLQMHL
jgi:two-component system LytT family sensor kinase